MSNITIYHNPDCRTSRAVLEIIRKRGFEPCIIEYLRTPPGREEVVSLITAMGKPARDLLRHKERVFEDLDLDNPKWSDDELIDFMITNPVLINRPVVATPLGTRLCRPVEDVLDILPQRE